MKRLPAVPLTPSLSQQKVIFSLAAILLLAFGLRVWGIGFGLPHRYHIDEPPYVLAALRIAQGDLVIDYPFNSPNLYQFLLAGEYGLLYVAGVSFGVFHSPADVAVLYRTDPTIFYLLARVTSALFGTIAVWIAYLAGRILYGVLGGLIAAIMLAAAFIHVRDSHYAVTDSLVALLALTCVYLSLRYLCSGRLATLALAGMAGGAAVGLKILPAPILIAPLLAIWYGRQVAPERQDYSYVVISLAALATATILGFFVAFPALFISPALFQTHIAQASGQAANSLGSLIIDPAPAAVYYLRTLAWGLGLPLLIAVCGGVGLAIVQRNHAQRIVAVTASVFFVGICLVNTTFARYALPLVPLGMILAAGFILSLANAAANVLGSRASQFMLVAITTLIVIASPLVASIRHDYLLTQTDTRTLAKRWIEQNVPEGTPIVTQWFGPPLSVTGDPEPVSNRTYDVVRLDPFTEDPTSYSLDSYRSGAAEYMILTSFVTGLQFRNGQVDDVRQSFVAALETTGELVAQFEPGPFSRETPFVFDELYGPAVDLWSRVRPGPEILVYRLTP